MAKYKAGDKVRVIREPVIDSTYCMEGVKRGYRFSDEMDKFKGRVVTITSVANNFYYDLDNYYFIDGDYNHRWTDGMFEGLAEPEPTPNPLHPIPIEQQMADPPAGCSANRALMFRAVMANPPFDLISGSDLIQNIKSRKAYMASLYTVVECKFDSLNNITAMKGIFNEVQPDTIGKCTNLTDKNGADIWEHDIVELAIDGEKYRATVHYDENGVWFERESGETYVYGEGCICAETDIEVLGNKFKNPELLEESQEIELDVEEEEEETENTLESAMKKLRETLDANGAAFNEGLRKAVESLRNPWIY